VRQAWRMIAAILAAAALAAGGSVAYADHGPGGGSGSGDNGEQHGHHGEGGEPGDNDGGQAQQPGDDQRHDQDKDDDAATAEVYTLSEPQHGNPEGIAFDERSGTFFVSATGDGSIYRGTLGDTATPLPCSSPARRASRPPG
jgi:hypothetical protein